MPRFMLRDEPKIWNPVPELLVEKWQVVRIDTTPSQVIAEFSGSNDPRYLSVDVAPLVAGDYTDFLNEKYADKNINEEWPPQRDSKKLLDYHIKMVYKYKKELEIEDIA